MSRYVCGVDPGKTGAVALLSLKDNSLRFIRIPLTGTEIDVPALIHDLRQVAPHIERCVMEEVHAIFGSSAKSTFQFGRVNGLIEGALHAAGIPFTKVQPKMWQKVAWKGVEVTKTPTKRVSKKTGEIIGKVDTKATSLRAARALFPGETFLATPRSTVPHDGRYDSALIAWYAKSTLPTGSKGFT